MPLPAGAGRILASRDESAGTRETGVTSSNGRLQASAAWVIGLLLATVIGFAAPHQVAAPSRDRRQGPAR
jgi:hypothetical protein